MMIPELPVAAGAGRDRWRRARVWDLWPAGALVELELDRDGVFRIPVEPPPVRSGSRRQRPSESAWPSGTFRDLGDFWRSDWP